MTVDYQVVLRGIFHDASGYSRASREHALALDALGVDIKIDPLNYGSPAAGLRRDQVDRLRALSDKPDAEGKQRILLVNVQPHSFDPALERKKYSAVVCSALWETTKIPEFWFPAVNRYDAIAANSRHVVAALRDSGVEPPVFHAPFGASAEFFVPRAEPLAFPGLDDHFKFLSVFQWSHRKAPDVLLRAFWSEFTRADRAVLVIKTQPGGSERLRDQLGLRDHISRVKQNMGFGEDRAPVLLSAGPLSDAQMRALYAAADVFVLPTRGEGVGLPFIEAMSTGVPVIATGWGGQMDFLTDENAWLIDYVLSSATASNGDAIAEVFPGLFTSEMQWAEPSLPHLRKLMREAYADRDSVTGKGARARHDMEAMTWETAARQLLSELTILIGRTSERLARVSSAGINTAGNRENGQ